MREPLAGSAAQKKHPDSAFSLPAADCGTKRTTIHALTHSPAGNSTPMKHISLVLGRFRA
jgi:hypothetical protein